MYKVIETLIMPCNEQGEGAVILFSVTQLSGKRFEKLVPRKSGTFVKVYLGRKSL